MTVAIKQTNWETDGVDLKAIRLEVFVAEQKVPLEEEIDQQDPFCTHFIACDSHNKPVACARLAASGQIGRMAVLGSLRGTGLGAKLLNYVLAYALKQNFNQIFLHAQVHAIGFYSKAGFELEGEEFLDAGIAHRNMIYPIAQ